MSESKLTTIRAAAVQMDVRLGENEENICRVLERLEEAAANGANLVVFPECAFSGYCFESLAAARPHACENPSEPIFRFSAECRKLNVVGVVGLLEAECDPRTQELPPNACYNSALLGNAGVPRKSSGQPGIFPSYVYRKTHLPTLGVDRFTSRGRSLQIYNTPYARVGILICYDIRFPEAARVLGLQGADVIALPTNWPEGAESSPEFITRTRAWENRVYIVAANRVGAERGRRFIGRSQIVSPTGEILCEAGGEEETILYADLDLNLARQKRIVIEPGEWELDITGDRRPDLYGKLVEE